MKQEVKEDVAMALMLLRNACTKNFLSMATDSEGNLIFFETDEYLEKGDLKNCDYFATNIEKITK